MLSFNVYYLQCSFEFTFTRAGGRYGYDKMMWKAYKKDLQKISNKGIMLLQCRTGARSGY